VRDRIAALLEYGRKHRTSEVAKALGS
jgi:hypothetical protein